MLCVLLVVYVRTVYVISQELLSQRAIFPSILYRCQYTFHVEKRLATLAKNANMMMTKLSSKFRTSVVMYDSFYGPHYWYIWPIVSVRIFYIQYWYWNKIILYAPRYYLAYITLTLMGYRVEILFPTLLRVSMRWLNWSAQLNHHNSKCGIWSLSN